MNKPEELSFKKWIQKEMTSTACVSTFAVPTISSMNRPDLNKLKFDKPTKKKKK